MSPTVAVPGQTGARQPGRKIVLGPFVLNGHGRQPGGPRSIGRVSRLVPLAPRIG